MKMTDLTISSLEWRPSFRLTKELLGVLKSFRAETLPVSSKCLDYKKPKRIWVPVAIQLQYRLFTIIFL